MPEISKASPLVTEIAPPSLQSQEQLRARESSVQAVGSDRRIDLLAYVHLRNIYRSTGAGRVARQLTEHLAARKDVNLRVLADRADHDRIVPLVGSPWDRYSYHLFQQETSRQQSRWFFLDKPGAEEFWPEAQVVFCTAESYVPVRRARLVVTLHDAAYFEPAAHHRNRDFSVQKLKWQLLFRKLDRRVDLFHTVSQFSADRLSHYYPAIQSRLRVVHNAVSPEFFRPVSEEGKTYLQDKGLNHRSFLLLPGGLHFRKNAELVLEAWPLLAQRYPDLLLVIVNHSSPDYLERLQSACTRACVLGFVPDEGLRALYSAARIVWFPSRYEGFGLPVIEAMACGTPVVASNSSSLPEISDGAALLASPDCPRAHVEALESLLECSSLWSGLAKRGLTRASHFTWQRSAAQLKSHFEELL